MNDMTYTRLGNSGLVVSRMALGTMTFNLGAEFIPGVANVGQDEATRMVQTALDHGVNFFDSADGYSDGQAEIALGTALAGKRQDAVICTKVGFRKGDAITDAGLSRRHLMTSVEGCLERLDTDYIDLLVVHKTDVFTPLEETLQALDDLVRAGKVRYIGCSNWPAWEVARAVEFQRANGMAQFIAGQYLYNAAARDIEVDVLRMTEQLGLSLMAWSPLAGGLLTGKYDLDRLEDGEGRMASGDFLQVPRAQAEAVLSALEAAARSHGLTVAQTALAWIVNKRRNHTVLIGASSTEQLEKSLKSGSITLNSDEMSAIDAAAPPPRRYPEWFADMMLDDMHKDALT